MMASMKSLAKLISSADVGRPVPVSAPAWASEPASQKHPELVEVARR